MRKVRKGSLGEFYQGVTRNWNNIGLDEQKNTRRCSRHACSGCSRELQEEDDGSFVWRRKMVGVVRAADEIFGNACNGQMVFFHVPGQPPGRSRTGRVPRIILVVRGGKCPERAYLLRGPRRESSCGGEASCRAYGMPTFMVWSKWWTNWFSGPLR